MVTLAGSLQKARSSSSTVINMTTWRLHTYMMIEHTRGRLDCSLTVQEILQPTRNPCDPKQDDTLMTIFFLPALSSGRKACVTA